MPGIDPLLLRAAAVRQAQQAAPQQGRGVQLGNVGKVRAEKAGRAQQAKQNASKGSAGPTDWGALVDQRNQRMGIKPTGGDGSLIGNIVKTATIPLQYLDYGRRALLSGVKEGADLVGELTGEGPGTRLFGNKTDESSWSDFMSQLKDPEFGFGEIVGDWTGNKWLDRAIGFGGDVVFDPLTYLLPGARAMGAGARVALAGEAAVKNLGKEAVEAAAQRGAQGVRSLGDEAAMKALNIPEAGLRFGTQKASVRIPGTGRLDEGLSNAMARLRAPMADSKIAQTMRLFGQSRDPEIRAAAEALLTGKGDAVANATQWAGLQAKRAGARGTTGIGEVAARTIGRKLGQDEAFTYALEAGETPNKWVQTWRDLNKALYQRQAKEGVSIGTEAENYVPHILTPEGAEGLGYAPAVGRGGADMTRAEAQQFSRKIVPGETFTIDGKEFTPVEGTLREANEWSQRELGYKLYEDRPDKLAALATERAASAVGKERYDQVLRQARQMASADNPLATTLDLEATRIASKGDAENQLAELMPSLQTLIGRDPLGRQTRESELMLRAYDRGAGRAKRQAYGEAYGAANEAQAAWRAAAEGMPENIAQREALQAQLASAQAAEAAARRPVDELAALADSGLQGPRALPDIPGVQAKRAQLEKQFQQLVNIARAAPDQQTMAQAVRRAKVVQQDIEEMFRRYADPVAGAPLPEAAPFEEALQRASGARQGVEEALAPVEAQYQRQAGLQHGPFPPAEGHTRLYRGEALEPPEPGPGLPAWMAGNPELEARNAVEGRWFTPERNVAASYPTNRDPGVGNKLRYVDVPNDVYEQIRGLADQPEAVRALSKDPREAILPDELLDRVRDVGSEVDEFVAQRVEPRLAELEAGRAPFQNYNLEATVNDLERMAQAGETRAAIEARIERYPEHARQMIRDIISDDVDGPKMEKFLSDVREGKLDNVVVRLANDGWQQLDTQLGTGDVYIRTEMRKAMTAFKGVMAKDPSLFGKVVDAYTQFFKSWATATPGFHIRNALSAVFMNMTEGVTFREMLDGRTIWKTYRKNPMGDWVSDLPERLRAAAPDVVEAVYASGAGGRYGASEVGRTAFREGSKLDAIANVAGGGRATEWSRNIGEKIEGEVRAGLALKAIGYDATGSMLDATQRIKRIHFDYSDVNELDQALRRIIPFWTFMSRNLPLQLQQMTLRPKTYAQFNSLMRNMDDDKEGQAFMPEWARQAGGIMLGPSTVLTPDVGATQLRTTLEQLTNPRKLATTFTPPLKTAIELGTNTDLYYGSRYKENDFIKPGFETSLIAQLLNLTEDTPQGPVLEQKFNQAIRDNLPLLATFNRLGSTTADREGKGMTSWLRFFGIPVSTVQPEAEANARRSDYYDQLDRQSRMQALAAFNGPA